ncbi:MAG TPA: PRC-barrel domain-containing protein [Kiloniellales bacterium]|nr:PRC-barrel domain-containing protein [Kiloniellales bacterium]
MRTRLRTILPLAALMFGGSSTANLVQASPAQPGDAPATNLTGEATMHLHGRIDILHELAQLRPLAGNYAGAKLPLDLPPSDLIGASIADVQGNRLARIRDLLADSRGKVMAVLAATGGFLGLWERQVAVPIEELILEHKEGDDYLSALSEDELAELPDYELPTGKS